MHKFVVYAPKNLGEAYIELDGKRLEGVTSLTLNMSGKRSELTLVVRGEVLIDGALKQIETLRGYNGGDFNGERCPRCSSPLLTDGKRVWCSFVGGRRLNSETATPACTYGIDTAIVAAPSAAQSQAAGR